MRITKLIYQREKAWILNQILSTILERQYEDQSGEFFMWILGLKGLKTCK